MVLLWEFPSRPNLFGMALLKDGGLEVIFFKVEESLWRFMVDAKYGSPWDECCSIKVNGLFGAGLWKNIGGSGGIFQLYLFSNDR